MPEHTGREAGPKLARQSFVTQFLYEDKSSTVDGRDTGQNAMTSDTCDADTSNKISCELGNTGHI